VDASVDHIGIELWSSVPKIGSFRMSRSSAEFPKMFRRGQRLMIIETGEIHETMNYL